MLTVPLNVVSGQLKHLFLIRGNKWIFFLKKAMQKVENLQRQISNFLEKIFFWWGIGVKGHYI